MKNKNEKTKFRLRDWVPIWAIVLFAVFAVAVIIEILSKSDKALADAINAAEPAGYTKEWDINGENVPLSVKRA